MNKLKFYVLHTNKIVKHLSLSLPLKILKNCWFKLNVIDQFNNRKIIHSREYVTFSLPDKLMW